MTIAYVDCVAGISGDMAVGALIDAGCPFDYLESELKKIPVKGYTLDSAAVMKNGIAARSFRVTVTPEHDHRTLADIGMIFNASTLDAHIIEKIMKIFTLLAHAEGAVHGADYRDVHFHEVGALDSIIDIAAAVIALDRLGVTKLFASPFHLGSGTTHSLHGIIPVPAPATLKLVEGKPFRQSDLQVELTTPTGAAILAALAEGFGPMPAMLLLKTGYGAGTRDLSIPNVTRVLIGEMETGAADESVTVLETAIDDMNPEIVPYLLELLFESGALDVYYRAVTMKKGRIGFLVTVLSPHEKAEALSSILFRESSTAGIRVTRAGRMTLARKQVDVVTAYGGVSLKELVTKEGKIFASPEFESCRAIAREKNIPLKEVYRAAMAAWSARE